MLDFVRQMFSRDFMPHAHCFLGNTGVLWLHVAADAATALAYYSIPFALLYFVRRRKDLAFHGMFLMFGAFIFACGTTHVMSIWTLWDPVYRAEGVVKLTTGLLSIGTALALVPLIPRALALPSHAELAAANTALEREIAERRVAEDAVRESGQWLGATLRSVGDGVIATNARGLVNFMNPVAERLTGCGQDDAFGRPMRDIFRLVRAANRQPMEEPVALALRSGTTVRQGDDLLLVGRDGSMRHVEYTVAPIEDPSGRTTGVVLVFRDVSARRQAEEDVLERSTLLRSITESITHYVDRGDWGAATDALLLCAMRLTGSRGGFMAARTAGGALRVLASRGMDAPSAAPLPAGVAEVEGGMFEIARPTGVYQSLLTRGEVELLNDPVALAATPVEPLLPGQSPLLRFLGLPALRAGQVMGVVCVTDSLTPYTGLDHARLESVTQIAGLLFESHRRALEERALQEQLQRAQRMEAVGRLAGGIAHDFNNLLTIAIGCSDAALGVMGDHPASADVQEIRNAAQRGAALTQQLLAFSRRQSMTLRAVDVTGVVAGTRGMLERLVGDDIRLTTDCGSGLWPVRADLHQLEQVILNLAINARDAMPHGGELALEARNLTAAEAATVAAEVPGGDCVALRVRDTGIGMSAEVRARIFEPFFTTKAVGQGTGLGLATVYGIVRQSGGAVAVDSAPGAGACFTVLLPRAVPAVEPVSADAVAPGARGTETVLLVEDQPVVRRLAAATLRASGYTVLEAVNGEDALRVLSLHDGNPPALLVTDVRMPVMGGPELARRLRETRPELAVLLISGHPDEATLDGNPQGLEFRVLPKPFDAAVLARAARETLDARRV